MIIKDYRSYYIISPKKQSKDVRSNHRAVILWLIKTDLISVTM